MILGKRTLIEERTSISGTSAQSFTYNNGFSSTYTNYIIELENVTEASGNIAVRYFTAHADGSNVVEQSGTNYSHVFDSFRPTIYRQASGQNMQTRHYDFYWKYRYDGYSIYFNPNISSQKHALVMGQTGYYAYTQSHGRYNSAIVSVGVKLFPNGGGSPQQFSGGKIRLFGVDKT